MREYRFTVFFEPLEAGGYNVIVPAIPEICTSGGTLDEARDMARDAIRCFIESASETGEPIPKDIEPTKEQIVVNFWSMSPPLPILKPRQVLRALERAGYYIHHQTGSHARLFHKDRPEWRVTIPIHSKDLPAATLHRILKQADLSIEEFEKLL